MKKHINAMVLGIVIIAVGLLFLVYHAYIFSFAYSQVGWKCPFLSACAPPTNSTAMNIEYPKAIELSNSKPVTIAAYISDIVPSKFSCQKPLDIIKSIDYEVQLSTAGIEIAPDSTQTLTDDGTSIAQEKGVEPSTTQERGLESSKAVVTWIVNPKQTGTYAFHVQVSATTQGCQLFTLNDIFEIQIVDIFGLTARQLRLLGIISIFLGAAVTLPGILDIIAKWKEKGSDKKNPDEETATIITSPSGKEKRIPVKNKDDKRRSQR